MEYITGPIPDYPDLLYLSGLHSHLLMHVRGTRQVYAGQHQKTYIAHLTSNLHPISLVNLYSLFSDYGRLGGGVVGGTRHLDHRYRAIED